MKDLSCHREIFSGQPRAILSERAVGAILALADNGMNVSRAAQSLYLHRNTVLYHIRKVKQETGLDPLHFYGLCELVDMVRGKRRRAGLTDKWGRMIFEGDIVKAPFCGKKLHTFIVRFTNGAFYAVPVGGAVDGQRPWKYLLGGENHNMEVIGNIHDNPELLEVSHEADQDH